MGNAMLRNNTRVAIQAVVAQPFAVLTKSRPIDQHAEGMSETAGHKSSFASRIWSRLPVTSIVTGRTRGAVSTRIRSTTIERPPGRVCALGDRIGSSTGAFPHSPDYGVCHAPPGARGRRVAAPWGRAPDATRATGRNASSPLSPGRARRSSEGRRGPLGDWPGGESVRPSSAREVTRRVPLPLSTVG